VLLTVSAVLGWEVTSTTAANTGASSTAGTSWAGATTLAFAAPPRV